MIRKQLYITENQQEKINELSTCIQRKESETIRMIIDEGIKIIKNRIKECN